MLRFGVIGYGGRIRGIISGLRQFDVPFAIAAISDPKGAEYKEADPEHLADTVLYDDAEALLDTEKLDGVLIGTRCSLHTPMALKVAQRGLPLFLEKPVATSMEQVRALDAAFRDYAPQVVVSFPLRLTTLCLTAKEIIDSGRLGDIHHVQAWNNVPYGWCYYGAWYRDFNETGGLFLQKATHDFDYISYLLDAKPKWVCAMNSQRVYGGDKPADLLCKDCGEQETCIESPFNLFYRRGQGAKVDGDSTMQCMFSENIKNEDSGNALLEFDSGVQASYSQNFFARGKAGARGARLFGYHGTVEFDWYTGEVKVFEHHSLRNDVIRFEAGGGHFGGDTELCYDFLQIVQGKGDSRSPIEAGVLSALTCLKARESAAERKFCEVTL
jgi:predicted dehydrogenase